MTIEEFARPLHADSIADGLRDQADAVADSVTATASAVAHDLRWSGAWAGRTRSLAELRAIDPNADVPEELTGLRVLNTAWHHTVAIGAAALFGFLAWMLEKPARALALAAIITATVYAVRIITG